MKASDRFFCSAQSRRNKELLFGTAPRVESWVLVEHPGAWKPDAIEESELLPELRRKLTSLGRGRRALLIRQSHESSLAATCFAAASLETEPQLHRVPFCDPAELCAADFTSLSSHQNASQADGPIFLVCTHGNHDKCCSKFGLPIYETLKQHAGADAWQCSHVGGDRFAANIVCFPHGIYYGHVTPGDVKKIVEAQQRGEIHLKNYRGRSCYTRRAQVAEYLLRRETGRARIDDFRLIEAHDTIGRFHASDGIHEIEFRARQGPCELLTCKSEVARPVVQYELVRHALLAPGEANFSIVQ